MEKVWPCGHVQAYSCNGKNPKDEWHCDPYGYVYGQPSFCPKCGTPRPAEQKRLDDILRISWSISTHNRGDLMLVQEGYKELALAAIEWMEAHINKLESYVMPSSMDEFYKWNKLKDILKEEKESLK